MLSQITRDLQDFHVLPGYAPYSQTNDKCITHNAVEEGTRRALLLLLINGRFFIGSFKNGETVKTNVKQQIMLYT